MENLCLTWAFFHPEFLFHYFAVQNFRIQLILRRFALEQTLSISPSLWKVASFHWNLNEWISRVVTRSSRSTFHGKPTPKPGQWVNVTGRRSLRYISVHGAFIYDVCLFALSIARSFLSNKTWNGKNDLKNYLYAINYEIKSFDFRNIPKFQLAKKLGSKIRVVKFVW